MEKRIGTVLIAIEDSRIVAQLNDVISIHADIIRARQGLPACINNTSIISLVLEGTTDQIGALSGQLGRLKGVQSKSILLKSKA